MELKKTVDRAILVLLIAFSLYLCYLAKDFPNRGGIFPIFSLTCIILLAGFNLVYTFVRRDGPPSEDGRKTSLLAAIDFKKISRNKPFLLFLLTVVQVYAMTRIGFYVTTTIFIVAAGYLIGLRRHRLLIMTSVIMMASFYLFFELALKSEFPRGILF